MVHATVLKRINGTSREAYHAVLDDKTDRQYFLGYSVKILTKKHTYQGTITSILYDHLFLKVPGSTAVKIMLREIKEISPK